MRLKVPSNVNVYPTQKHSVTCLHIYFSSCESSIGRGSASVGGWWGLHAHCERCSHSCLFSIFFEREAAPRLLPRFLRQGVSYFCGSACVSRKSHEAFFVYICMSGIACCADLFEPEYKNPIYFMLTLCKVKGHRVCSVSL